LSFSKKLKKKLKIEIEIAKIFSKIILPRYELRPRPRD
jgi:hypothetical protein